MDTERSHAHDEETFRSQYAMMLRQLKYLDTSVLQETDLESDYVMDLSAITNASKYVARAFENESAVGENSPLHSTVINAPQIETETRLNNTPNSCENELCGERSRYTPCGSDASGVSLGECRNIDLLLNTSLSTYNYNGMQLCESQSKKPAALKKRYSRELLATPNYTDQENSGYTSQSQPTASQTRLSGNSNTRVSLQHGLTSSDTDSRMTRPNEPDASILGLSMAVNTSFTICEENDTSYDGYEIDLDDMTGSPLQGQTPLTQSCASSIWSPEVQQSNLVAHYMQCHAINRPRPHTCAAAQALRSHTPDMYDLGPSTVNGHTHISTNQSCHRHNRSANRHSAGVNMYMHTARPSPEGKEATPIYSQMSQKNLRKFTDCSPTLKPQRHSQSYAKRPSTHSMEQLTDQFEVMEIKRHSRVMFPSEQSQHCASANAAACSASNNHERPEISHNAPVSHTLDTRHMNLGNNTMLSTASTLANRDCRMVCVPVKFMKSNVFKKMRKIGKKVNETQGKTVSTKNISKETTFQMLGSV